MMIGKINTVNPYMVQSTRKVNAMEGVTSSPDTIAISEEARAASESYFLAQVAKETPDVREDLVASIKEKIKDPNYLNPERIGLAADRIMAAYGF
ncbi:MAG: flagellar biosynthesis anti-sigma factor FlgM [Treponema sp.]|uniref:flagellar biosynthesis anti-sigma factor FlgM n=1 Tax=Treponema sp. TaxID=166 RepID=UPI0025FE9DB4|nr:flagellar biosynthesis anti-sigma factor FlgM [Treponema sp.]MBR0497162.1 flagellar biosynthesis anti-sigma factor FlgM [Treponema sp.]